MNHHTDYIEQVLFDIGTMLPTCQDAPLLEQARLCDKIAFQSGMLYEALHKPDNKLRIMTLLISLAAMCVRAIVAMRAGTFDYEKEYKDEEKNGV